MMIQLSPSERSSIYASPLERVAVAAVAAASNCWLRC